MRSIAFLSTDDLEDFEVYDELTYPAFAERGVAVEAVPWRADVRWEDYEAVVIRSPWDYQDDWRSFLEVLERIDGATRLENPLAVVRWNIDKMYLRDLERRGVPIVPTRWIDRWSPQAALEALDHWRISEVVVKPRISANADGTFRLDREALDARRDELARSYGARPLMIQPFVPAVVEEGELSLFVFDGAPSHAVRKTPAAGDFRVQEEHGGAIRTIEPEPAAEAIAERVLAALDGATGCSTLYARVDLVRLDEGDDWRLMELELIEPSLYFPYDPESPARFAEACLRRWGRDA